MIDRVLQKLVRRPGMTTTYLALLCRVSDAQMSEVVGVAITKGWLTEHKICCGADPTLHLTEAGRQVADGV